MFLKSLAIVAGVLAAVLLAPQDVHAQTRLWTTSMASGAKCRAYASATGPESFSTSVTGFKWPMPRGSGAAFIDGTIRHLNAAAAGRANDAALRDRLLTAAANKAFTRIDWEGPGGASPAFLSSVMVRTVAYAVSYLRSRNALSASDMTTLSAWVKTLLRNSGQRATSTDHKASIGAAMIAWGAATGDRALMKTGQNRLNTVMGKLRAAPRFDQKVRVNTEVLPIVLMAAHILSLNGQDLFGKAFGKNSLHDAVAFHAQWVLRTGTAKVNTIAAARDEARSVMRKSGWGTHQAWIPLYLAHFPSGPASDDVRALHRAVSRAQGGAYLGWNMGIHSSCHFGL